MAISMEEVLLKFVNEAEFSSNTLSEAQKGISFARRRELLKSTVIYRFASAEGLALQGSWWLEESQFMRAKQWAVINNLTLVHAVRVLCAIAHKYSAMRVLVRAQIQKALLAYEGVGKAQTIDDNSTILESINPATLGNVYGIRQLYIPGLLDVKLNRESLNLLSIQHFSEGDSHIGGVPNFPKGAVIQ